jgi:hypothetical protein
MSPSLIGFFILHLYYITQVVIKREFTVWWGEQDRLSLWTKVLGTLRLHRLNKTFQHQGTRNSRQTSGPRSARYTACTIRCPSISCPKHSTVSFEAECQQAKMCDHFTCTSFECLLFPEYILFRYIFNRLRTVYSPHIKAVYCKAQIYFKILLT